MDLKDLSSSNNDVENPVSNGVRRGSTKTTALTVPATTTTTTATAKSTSVDAGSFRSSHLDLTGRDGVLGFFPWWCFQKKFVHEDVERLYQEYYYKQKQHDTVWLFVTAAIFSTYSLYLHWASVPDTWTDKRLVLVAFCVVDILAVLLFHFLELELPDAAWTFVPLVSWALFYVQVFVGDSVIDADGHRHTGNWTDPLGWTLVLVYVVYVLLPARLLFCVVLSCVTLITHIVLIGVSLPADSGVVKQLMANIFLLICANLLGAMSHVFTDKKHRKSYLETRTAMRIKLELEERTREQERLLLSVLPEHVAQQIRKDIGEAVDGQFKKIYMSRHENVSILFADIVGFTAISSTYSAVDLVRILNELFARFDKLAEKFHQLRIKILGDCYYCISGAPKERSDHAVLCVHMGLSMVDAIKYVREKTNSPVDMRVGIHTGAVLAGILGQRQWQFDVYSKDVELANKMESSGKQGRVHISEKTYAYLNGEFEVEPGAGSSRDEIIKSAGIKTYFIVRILKPYPNGTLDEDTGHILENVMEEPTTDTDESIAREDSKMLADEAKHNDENYRKRLFQEQVNRGKKRHLYKVCNVMTLSFKNKQMEDEYNGQMANAVGETTISAPIVALLGTLAQLIVLPGTVVSYLALFFGNVAVIALSLVSISPILSKRIHRSIRQLGKGINESHIRRHLWLFIIVGLLVLINVTNMLFCEMESGKFASNANLTVEAVRDLCVNPQYFTGYSVLVLLAVTVLLHVSYPMKLALISAVTGLQVYMNVVYLSLPFTLSDVHLLGTGIISYAISRKYSLSAMLASIALALVFINRHMEAASRLLFKWKKEVEEQKGQVDQVMHKTVTLVYNILPQHVANIFLKSNMRHDELYSQGYTEVGVLFASMPNFSDFYSEESVNNQGLECLRFLNEVISDFDALLEESRFFDIIKIKTTGATYMAASGLNDTQEFEADTPIRKRWAHLDRLTQFALALKVTLNVINEQSFNNFILRMGINHGPIIAGVIGARKPHYDMWGNTVNVASRMESTGKAGCIQVVEETANILREFGYEFEQRGMVQVKGKGHLMTYYLVGHTANTAS